MTIDKNQFIDGHDWENRVISLSDNLNYIRCKNCRQVKYILSKRDAKTYGHKERFSGIGCKKAIMLKALKW